MDGKVQLFYTQVYRWDDNIFYIKSLRDILLMTLSPFTTEYSYIKEYK